MIQHMVLLRFKPEVSEERIEAFFDLVAELKQYIPGMRYFGAGNYSSPEGLNQGFTHAFLVTFDTFQARDEYLTHPEHDRVKDIILPHVENVLVFDFEE